jgi:hypothetical protein
MERRAGIAAIVGATAAIVGNTVVLLVDPAVGDDRVSYPLSTGAFAVGQVWFALTQALMALGIFALARSTIVAPGRGRSLQGAMAWAGMAITVPGELVLIGVAARDVDSNAAATASSVFGVGIFLADLGLIGLGVLALRQRRWSLPWRALPLTYGLFQLLVATPLSLSQGFASVASYVGIAVADVLMALIGVALLQNRLTADFPSRDGSVEA